MDAALNLQDLAQWCAFAVVLGGLWWRIKQRDANLVAIAEWRTNIKRDVEEVDKKVDREVKAITERLNRHEAHDNRLFDRLNAIVEELKGVSERLVRIESRMNGG